MALLRRTLHVVITLHEGLDLQKVFHIVRKSTILPLDHN